MRGKFPYRRLADFAGSRREWTPRLLCLIACLFTPVPALALADLASAPPKLALQVATTSPGDTCRRVETADPASLARVSLHRTFHDDFDTHPLANDRWVLHYAGGAAWPEAQYWGGAGSDFRRKDKWNGEQQIYVDPRYGGRDTTPLGLDPFKVRDGILSIVATRTPAALKPVLFNNEYVSGILTTQSRFSQKHGYFEIRSKIPAGVGVWPAFWLLADDGGWPPEIDVLEGRGPKSNNLVMTTHWRIPETQRVEHCGFDFPVADTSRAFHDYVCAVAAGPHYLPVSEIKAPIGFDDPMYMIVNLAMGSNHFPGVGFVDSESPVTVAFEIDRISAYQIDER